MKTLVSKNFRQTVILIIIVLPIVTAAYIHQENEDGEEKYDRFCAQCHGADLDGGNASSLIDGIWQYGAGNGYITRNIEYGIPDLGMPSYEKTLTDREIQSVVEYMCDAEKQKGTVKPPVPKVLETMDYFIDVEIFAEGLEMPWAIDFIDLNTALITERPGRLRIVRNGRLLKEPVRNTPEVLHEGQGGLPDVAVDPEYDENGWIYLAYSHVLDNVGGNGRPPSMTRIIRGRIENNLWTANCCMRT